MYGGGAGGGKSHLERVESIALCLEIPGLQYFLFRRNFQDLKKSYIEGPNGYDAMLGELIHEGQVESVAKEIRFPNGSKIYLCHCQHEKNVFGFNSFEFHVLNIAEAGEFTPFMIKYLRSRVRMDKVFQSKLPKRFLMPRQYWRAGNIKEYTLPRAAYSCNPVGPGKAFLKRTFVDSAEPGKIWRAPDSEGGMLRQFIPALLGDNPSLDPVQYAAQLQGIGSPAYIDALLNGLWTSTIGAFFPEVDIKQHLIRPFQLPSHWPRYMSMDWGACGEGDPFSIGWFTVSDGSAIGLPRGSIIWYRRWNGRGMQKTTAKAIAEGILKRESKDPEIVSRCAGGDIIDQRGHGESIFEIFANNGVYMSRADTRRASGWQQIRERLVGENGTPRMFWFDTCEEDLDTMQTLQHDITGDKNDCAPGDDHDADRIRYGCMMRPYAVESKIIQPPKGIHEMTLQQLLKAERRYARA